MEKPVTKCLLKKFHFEFLYKSDIKMKEFGENKMFYVYRRIHWDV